MSDRENWFVRYWGGSSPWPSFVFAGFWFALAIAWGLVPLFDDDVPKHHWPIFWGWLAVAVAYLVVAIVTWRRRRTKIGD